MNRNLAEYLGGDRALADFESGYAPPAPAGLKGERAIAMLDYLPDYYEASTFVRALLQAEGYEHDYQWYIAVDVIPLLTRPIECPEWVLDMWEAVLRIPGREIWGAADRRRSLTARLSPASQEQDVKAFLAAEARCDVAQLAFSFTVDYQADITTTGLSAGQVDAVTAAAGIVIPAHMKFSVDAVVIR